MPLEQLAHLKFVGDHWEVDEHNAYYKIRSMRFNKKKIGRKDNRITVRNS